MKAVGYIKTYLVIFACVAHIDGKVSVFQTTTTWINANSLCVSKGGTLARNGGVTCQQVLKGSVWLGEYQAYVWLRPLGCYILHEKSKNMTAGVIEECIQNCNTNYIGFLKPRCFCFESPPIYQSPLHYGMCESGINTTRVYKTDEITASYSTNDKCVIAECIGQNQRTYVLKPSECQFEFPGTCDRHTILNAMTYDELKQTCDANNSFIQNDEICSLLSNINENSFWTGIQRFTKNLYSDNTVLNHTQPITKCRIGTCLNNGHKMTAYWDYCDKNVDGFVCNIEGNISVTILKKDDTADIKPTHHSIFINSSITYKMTSEMHMSSQKAINIFEKRSTVNAELIAGVFATAVSIGIIAVGFVLFVRRRQLCLNVDKGHNDDMLSNKAETYNPTQGVKLRNNGIHGLTHKNNDCPKSNKTFEPVHEEIAGQEYALVIKHNHQNKVSDGTKSHEEDDYNRIDHVMKVDTQAITVNVYDTMIGVRGEETTYNTAMIHNIKNRECHYDTFTIECQ